MYNSVADMLEASAMWMKVKETGWQVSTCLGREYRNRSRKIDGDAQLELRIARLFSLILRLLLDSPREAKGKR